LQFILAAVAGWLERDSASDNTGAEMNTRAGLG
jgi:hypothetical protein